MTKIFWRSSPLTLTLTWDDAWHSYDFTSVTSANAKGVFLGVYLYRSGGDNYTGYFYTAIYNNSAWEGIVQINGSVGDGFEVGGTITQAIDSQQRMNYKGSQAATSSKIVKLLGYWE